jgi:gamma-butyrobetaine dioxygenase
MKPKSVHYDSSRLVVCWPDGHESIFESIWLLDNSPEHRDDRTGQRLVDVADLPEDPQISNAGFDDGWIEVAWAGIGKRSRFSAQWLEERCNCNEHICSSGRRTLELTLWRAQDCGRFCTMDYREFCESITASVDWLRAAASWGIAFLRRVPCEEGEVLRAASFIGWVRETNYGRVFDVAVSPRPNNLAYTNTALGLHTDNPYRDPVPGLQILHCLKAGAGGESLFADGFAVAETLRQTDRPAFDLIAGTEVEFRFADAGTELTASRPLIHLHRDGTIAAVHYNSRSIAPLKLAAGDMASFYQAYRQFARLLRDPRFEARIRLEPGDLVLLDNRRVLHGRTAFSSSEPRLLQGCYLEHDGLASNLSVLERCSGNRYGFR